jgi:hypothetical protein
VGNIKVLSRKNETVVMFLAVHVDKEKKLLGKVEWKKIVKNVKENLESSYK